MKRDQIPRMQRAERYNPLHEGAIEPSCLAKNSLADERNAGPPHEFDELAAFPLEAHLPRVKGFTEKMKEPAGRCMQLGARIPRRKEGRSMILPIVPPVLQIINELEEHTEPE